MRPKKQPKASVIPRKKPLQKRASETVKAILEATTHILCREGYEGASTNRIAEKAGVSIGSLYQYFPSKESIIAVLVEKKFAEEFTLIEATLSAGTGRALEDVVHDLFDAIVQNHRKNPKLRKVLIEEVPRTGKLAQLMNYQSKVADKVAEYLARRKDLRSIDTHTVAFILTHALDAVIHAGGSKDMDALEDPTFIKECSELICRYLKN